MVKREEEIKTLDLFSGIGGFSLGLRRASPRFRTVAYCEINPYCQKVLQARMSDGSLDTAPICSDITKLDGKPWRGRVDLICGGFPCQDISIAGKRAGIEGAQSGLWSEFARLIGEIRPRLVFVENVSALLANGGVRVLADLASLGYDAEWDVVPACSVGAPHIRERVWIVAYPEGERFSKARELQRGRSTERFSSSDETGAASDIDGIRRGEAVCAESKNASCNDVWKRAAHRKQRNAEQSRSDKDNGLLSADSWKGRKQRIFQGEIQRVGAFSWCENVRGPSDFFGRPDIPEPLFRGSRDGVPRWMERIESLGNAVVPQIVEWIGRRIIEIA